MNFGIIQADGSILKLPATEGHIVWLIEPNDDYWAFSLRAVCDMLREDTAPGMEATAAAFIMPSVVTYEVCLCIPSHPHYIVGVGNGS